MKIEDAEHVVEALDRYLSAQVARDNLALRSVATTRSERAAAEQTIQDARGALVAALTTDH